MNIKNIVSISDYELERFCDRQSFYGKASILTSGKGMNYLKSYDTIVCYTDTKGRFHRTWDGYSSTSMRHINAFCKAMNINGGGKKWWEELKVEKI